MEQFTTTLILMKQSLIIHQNDCKTEATFYISIFSLHVTNFLIVKFMYSSHFICIVKYQKELKSTLSTLQNLMQTLRA